MVPWSKIDILGRYTYYRSAAQAERRVARSLSKIAMQLTPSPAKNSIAGPGRGVAGLAARGLGGLRSRLILTEVY